LIKSGTIHRLTFLLHDGITRLGAQCSVQKLEELTFLLYQSLMSKGREFHSFDHVFSFLQADDHPLFLLAALFHDQVYYQVDQGFTSAVRKLIGPFILEQKSKDTSSGTGGTVYLRKKLPGDIPALQLSLKVFGFEAGKELSPFEGLNEFLSALVMALSLSPVLSLGDLCRIAAYIEATIPFRPQDDQGRSPFDRLASRLEESNKALNLGWQTKDITAIVQEAVRFANTDVANFAVQEPSEFLDNTWDLIPETNRNLRQTGVYSIRDYRTALQKMRAFFSFLKPELVFHQYKGKPSDRELAGLTAAAAQNMSIARDYLGIKLLASAILEALAMATGGEAPIAYFMGDLPNQESDEGDTPENEGKSRLEHFLPPVTPKNPKIKKETLYRLFAHGRTSDSSFDMKKAPLSLFLYLSLEPDEVDALLEKAAKLFTGEWGAQEFIQQLKPEVLGPIAHAASAMVYTRKEALLALVEKNQ
jgi:hypothetical protein